MTQIKANQSKKTPFFKPVNPIESSKSNIDPFEQFFGQFNERSQSEIQSDAAKEGKATTGQRREFSIFSYQNYYENEIVKKQVKELTEQVKKEIAFIKKADTALAAEVANIEKLSLQSLPEKPGIYHVRFLEIILRILKSLREKIGESRTWLAAMVSRKKKRGSLFLSLSKKKGTQYSLSQELTTARAVQ